MAKTVEELEERIEELEAQLDEAETDRDYYQNIVEEIRGIV